MYCQNCGSKRADGSVVCESCGPVAMTASHVHGPKPASSGVRFANMLVDKIAAVAIAIIIVALAALASRHGGRMHGYHSGMGLVLALVYLAYYFIFEACCQRTLGKLITGTKVVRMDGGMPTISQTLGRTFARIIPFEAFSFFGLNTVGWHDRFSCTLVVPAGMSAEQVRAIDIAKYKKTNTLAATIAVVLTGFLVLFMCAAAMFAAFGAARDQAWSDNGNGMGDGSQSWNDQSGGGYGNYDSGVQDPGMMNGNGMGMGNSGITGTAPQQ